MSGISGPGLQWGLEIWGLQGDSGYGGKKKDAKSRPPTVAQGVIGVIQTARLMRSFINIMLQAVMDLPHPLPESYGDKDINGDICEHRGVSGVPEREGGRRGAELLLSSKLGLYSFNSVRSARALLSYCGSALESTSSGSGASC